VPPPPQKTRKAPARTHPRHPNHHPQELLSLPKDQAALRAAALIQLLGLRNTYALGKHLAEKAVAALQRERRLPLAILRPSLVSAVALEPYPGYSGMGVCSGLLAWFVWADATTAQ
jgi:hypothetical protein